VQDLTTGSVSRHLLKTTGFMLVTMVFQTLYFLVDLYWVGRLGKEAVAAVGIAGNLMFVVLALTQVLGVGTTTMVSHAVGRRDHDRALRVFNQSLVLAVLAGVLFLALAGAIGGAYARTLSADATTAALASDYLRWFVPALGLQFAMVAMAAALRGSGNFKPGMVVQTATVILNMLLAPVLSLDGSRTDRWAWRARRSPRSSPSSRARAGCCSTSSRAKPHSGSCRPTGSRSCGSGARC